MMVCSLMTISVVSAFGRETRAAMAAASVSRMILSTLASSLSIGARILDIGQMFFRLFPTLS